MTWVLKFKTQGNPFLILGWNSAQTYLQPHFSSVYLSAGQHKEINIAVMGVVDTFGQRAVAAAAIAIYTNEPHSLNK